MHSTTSGDCVEVRILIIPCIDVLEENVCEERLVNFSPAGLVAEYLGNRNGMEVRIDGVSCRGSDMLLVIQVRTKSFSDRFCRSRMKEGR